MKRVLLALILAGLALPAMAADVQPYRPASVERSLPFPRGEQAQAVWASRACLSECGSYCAWGFADCLKRDTQGVCLQYTDRCDRICQSDCRTSGGPLLGLID